MSPRTGRRHPGPLLDAYLDGELNRRQRHEVERHLRTCARCRADLTAHTTLHERMRKVPLLSCPEGVVGRVQAMTARGPAARRSFAFRPRLAWRLAMAGAAVAVAVLLLVRHEPWQRPAPEEAGYSSEEVMQARRDAERALTYVSYALQLAQQTLEQEVLPAQMVKALRRGVSTALGVLTENGGQR